MMIRERGGRIQLVRTEYVAVERDEEGRRIQGTGRGKQVIVGTFKRYISSVKNIDSVLVDKLTDDEKKELEAWLAEREEKAKKVNLSYAPMSVVSSLKDLAKNYDQAPLSDDQVEAIKTAMSELLAARRAYNKKH